MAKALPKIVGQIVRGLIRTDQEGRLDGPLPTVFAIKKQVDEVLELDDGKNPRFKGLRLLNGFCSRIKQDWDNVSKKLEKLGVADMIADLEAESKRGEAVEKAEEKAEDVKPEKKPSENRATRREYKRQKAKAEKAKKTKKTKKKTRKAK